MPDPFFIPGLVKMFFDTVSEGPKGAAKGLAGMALGPVGNALDAADLVGVGRRGRDLGTQVSELLVDPRTGRRNGAPKVRYTYCAAGDNCNCGLPKVCLRSNCNCSRRKACDRDDSCRCGRLKVCTRSYCNCRRPKAYTG